MFLKMMSGEDAADSDTRKRFRMLADVTAVEFERVGFSMEESEPRARVTFKDGSVEDFFLGGNCYVLNDNGKTIGSFGRAPIPNLYAPPAPPPSE